MQCVLRRDANVAVIKIETHELIEEFKNMVKFHLASGYWTKEDARGFMRQTILEIEDELEKC